MNSLMMAQMGLGAMGQLSDFMEARNTAKMEKRMQQFRNFATKLNAARQMNAISTNEVRIRDSAMQAQELIQKTSIVDQGRAAVAAAAAGVSGNSVKMVERDLKGSAARASYSQRRQTNQQLSDLSEARTSVAIGAIIGQDMQVIPKPSASALLLGVGAQTLSIYESHQPEGNRLLR